jgi:hypothetical protein
MGLHQITDDDDDDDDFPQKIGVSNVFADVFATRLQACYR